MLEERLCPNFFSFSSHFVMPMRNYPLKDVNYSRIRTEYWEIRSISPYSVRMRENTDQKKLRIWTHFTQCDSHISSIFGSFLRVQNFLATFYNSSKSLRVPLWGPPWLHSLRYFKKTQTQQTNTYLKSAIGELEKGVKFVIRTSKHWSRSGVFIVNFRHISHLFSVFLLLTLNR